LYILFDPGKSWGGLSKGSPELGAAATEIIQQAEILHQSILLAMGTHKPSIYALGYYVLGCGFTLGKVTRSTALPKAIKRDTDL